jgi:hypothetical protein
MSAKKTPRPDSDTPDPEVIDLGPEAIIDNDIPERVAPSVEPETPPTAQQIPNPRQTSRGWVVPLAALCIGAIGGGWLYRNLIFSYLPPDQVTMLESKIAALESAKAEADTQAALLSRLAEQLKSDVDQIVTSASTANKNTSALKTSQDVFATRVTKVETTLAETAKRLDTVNSAIATIGQSASPGRPIDTTAMVALASRVETLEQDLATFKQGKTQSTNATALLQNLSDLKFRIDAGAPYASELATLATILPAAEGLNVLAASADKGVANGAALTAELETLAPSLPGAAPPPAPAEQGYMEWVTGWFDGLVTVKTIGDTDWQQIAREALAFARTGNLQHAIGVIDKIETTKPESLTDWRNRAEARVNLDAALSRLSDAVLRQSAAKG